MLSKLHLVIIICKSPPFVFLLLIRLAVLISAWLLFTAGPGRGQAISEVQGGLETVAVTVANTPQSLGNGAWGGLDHRGCENGAGWGILSTWSHLISPGSCWVVTVLGYCGPELQVFLIELSLMLNHQEKLMDAFPKTQILSCLQGVTRAGVCQGNVCLGLSWFVVFGRN